MTISVEVPTALAGERVDRLVALVAGASRAQAASLVSGGAVRLDGRAVTTRSTRVEGGERLTVDWDGPPPPPGLTPDASVVLDVLYADEHVIVVDKAAGVVVHPGSGVGRGTLAQGLLARYPELADVGEPSRPGIVHRLDRSTSGLLVVARTAAAYQRLVEALSERDVERVYQALVVGHVESQSGVVDAPLGRSPREPTKRAVVENGRPARTRYEVERRYDRPAALTLLTCRLETGRTHQIRVHLQAIGHPVVGDDRYGGRGVDVGLARPFLHARELAFAHPHSGEAMRFSSPLAPELQAVLDAIES